MGHSDTHRTLHDMFNRRDFDGMDAHVIEDIVYEDMARSMTMKNRDEFKDWLREWTTAFSDAKVGTVEYLDGPNYSLARFRGTGHNDGPLGPFQATQRMMDIPLWEVLHFDGAGQCTSGEIIYDQASMLGQLGHIELPG